MNEKAREQHVLMRAASKKVRGEPLTAEESEIYEKAVREWGYKPLTEEERRYGQALFDLDAMNPPWNGIDHSKDTPETNKFIAAELEKKGRHWQAEYTLKFGPDTNPWFWGQPKPEWEDFYKMCVLENHEWDWYTDPPPPTINL